MLECGWCAFASKDYVAAHGLPATFEALAKHRLVLYITAMHGIPQLRWMEDYKAANTPITRVDNLEIMSQVLSSAAGIGTLPYFIGAENANLVRVFREPIGSNTGYIVYHEAVRNTERVRATVDALGKFFESRQNLFTSIRDADDNRAPAANKQ